MKTYFHKGPMNTTGVLKLDRRQRNFSQSQVERYKTRVVQIMKSPIEGKVFTSILSPNQVKNIWVNDTPRHTVEWELHVSPSFDGGCTFRFVLNKRK